MAKTPPPAEKFATIPVKTLEQFYLDLEAGELFGFYDIPEEVYRPAPGHNWSTIRHIQKSANSYDYYKNREKGPDEKQKDHFTLGHLFHCLVLEPDTLDERYTTYPETYPAKGKKVADPPVDKPWNMNAGFCKVWAAEMRAKGVETVSRKMMYQAKGMAATLLRIPAVQHKLQDVAGFEIAAFWIDAVHGCLCKGKLDALRQTGEIVDLKSYRVKGETQDPNEAALSTIFWEQYHCQMAMYRDGVDTILRQLRLLPKNEALLFTYLMTDKTPERDTVILHIDARKDQECLSTPWYRCGQITYRDCLKKVIQCEESGHWPSHNPGADGFTEALEAYVPEFLDKRLCTDTM